MPKSRNHTKITRRAARACQLAWSKEPQVTMDRYHGGYQFELTQFSDLKIAEKRLFMVLWG